MRLQVDSSATSGAALRGLRRRGGRESRAAPARAARAGTRNARADRAARSCGSGRARKHSWPDYKICRARHGASRTARVARARRLRSNSLPVQPRREPVGSIRRPEPPVRTSCSRRSRRAALRCAGQARLAQRTAHRALAPAGAVVDGAAAHRLVGGLVVFGRDGMMAAYGAMVVAMALALSVGRLRAGPRSLTRHSRPSTKRPGRLIAKVSSRLASVATTCADQVVQAECTAMPTISMPSSAPSSAVAWNLSHDRRGRRERRRCSGGCRSTPPARRPRRRNPTPARPAMAGFNAQEAARSAPRLRWHRRACSAAAASSVWKRVRA